MKKKILLILIILILAALAALVYLNKVILPVKIKSLIVKTLEEKTRKEVSLESVQLNIFKGLVLKNLVISDQGRLLASVKEGSCTFLFWPFFKKTVVIPAVKIKSPVIFLERRSDNRLNLADLFVPLIGPAADKSGFKFFVHKINLTGGSLNFKDNTLHPAFTRDMDKINLNIYLSLPAKLKFFFKSEIPAQANIKVSAGGEFKLPERELSAKITLKDLSLSEFSPYYENFGISIPPKIIDALVNLNFKDNLLTLAASAPRLPLQAKLSMANFRAPEVNLELSYQDFWLKGNFLVKDKLINIAGLSAKYFNSGVSLAGNVNTAKGADFQANLDGRLNLDLTDIPEVFKNSAPALKPVSLNGRVEADFNLNGRINNFKSWLVEAKLSSPAISAYGLKSGQLAMDYRQSDGIASIPAFNLSCYEGMIKAQAGANLNAQNFPFWVEANMEGVKIEQLKLDTAARDTRISGTIYAQAKLNGFSGDLAKLNGTGRILVNQGNLWQLSLFKGIGELIFGSQFAQVVFSEGACDFLIQDKYISTENLTLKSQMVNLSGPCRIGFDGSIAADIGVEIIDKNAPIANTLKDLASAIIGQIGEFGTIKISGTLKEPKYKFQPAVVNIINTLKDSLLEKIFKK